MDKLEGSEVDSWAMPELEPVELAFIADYSIHGNASEAWRASHPGNKSNNVNIRAFEFKNRPNVRKALRAMAMAGAREIAVTAQSHIERLTELATEARAMGKMGAAVRAEELIGKVSRLYVTQIETTHIEKLSDADLAAELTRETDMTPDEIMSLLGKYKDKSGGKPVTH